MPTTQPVTGSAYEEISQLIALAGHVVDHKQWDRLGEVFADDGAFILASGAAHEGLPAIRTMMETFQHPIAHYTTNVFVTVEPDGTHATSHSKCLNPNQTGQLTIAEYDDSLVRTDAGWRLLRRQASIRARWPDETTTG